MRVGRWVAVAAGAAVALGLAAAPAAAGKGEYVGVWSATGAVGFAVPGTDEYGDSFAWRLGVGYTPHPSFAVELEYAGWKSQVSQPEPNGIPAYTVASGELRVRPLTVTAQYRYPLPEYPITGYLLGGVGYYTVEYAMAAAARRVYEESGTIGLPDQKVESAFGWHLGAGAEYAVTGRVSLVGEGRYVFLSPDASGTSTPGYRISGSLDLDTWLFTAGVKVSF